MLPSLKEEEKDEDEYLSQGVTSPSGSVVLRGPSLADIVGNGDHAAYYSTLLESAMTEKLPSPITRDDRRDLCYCGEDHSEQIMRDRLDEHLAVGRRHEERTRRRRRRRTQPNVVPDNLDEITENEATETGVRFQPIQLITEFFPDVSIRMTQLDRMPRFDQLRTPNDEVRLVPILPPPEIPRLPPGVQFARGEIPRIPDIHIERDEAPHVRDAQLMRNEMLRLRDVHLVGGLPNPP